MEIDNAIIDQTTVDAIHETIGNVYEYGKDNNLAGLTLAEVSGIIRMAEAIKEMLRKGP